MSGLVLMILKFTPAIAVIYFLALIWIVPATIMEEVSPIVFFAFIRYSAHIVVGLGFLTFAYVWLTQGLDSRDVLELIAFLVFAIAIETCLKAAGKE